MNRIFLFALISGALYVAEFSGSIGSPKIGVSISPQEATLDDSVWGCGGCTDWNDAKSVADAHIEAQGGKWVTITSVTGADGEGSIPIGSAPPSDN